MGCAPSNNDNDEQSKKVYIVNQNINNNTDLNKGKASPNLSNNKYSTPTQSTTTKKQTNSQKNVSVKEDLKKSNVLISKSKDVSKQKNPIITNNNLINNNHDDGFFILTPNLNSLKNQANMRKSQISMRSSQNFNKDNKDEKRMTNSSKINAKNVNPYKIDSEDQNTSFDQIFKNRGTLLSKAETQKIVESQNEEDKKKEDKKSSINYNKSGLKKLDQQKLKNLAKIYGLE